MQKLMPAIAFIAELVRTYQMRRVSRSAAEFAYFLTLSIFPLLICAVAILASFEMSIENLFDDLWAADVVLAVQGYISHVGTIPTARIALIAVTVIVTSSSASFRAVAKSMEEIQGKPRYRGFWGLVVSFIFSLLLLFTIYFSVLMITTGAWLMEEVEYALGLYGFAAAWQRLRFALLFASRSSGALDLCLHSPERAQGQAIAGCDFGNCGPGGGEYAFFSFHGGFRTISVDLRILGLVYFADGVGLSVREYLDYGQCVQYRLARVAEQG